MSEVCICGHHAYEHVGLCVEECSRCGCRIYVRDHRVTDWPPPDQGAQASFFDAPPDRPANAIHGDERR